MKLLFSSTFVSQHLQFLGTAHGRNTNAMQKGKSISDGEPLSGQLYEVSRCIVPSNAHFDSLHLRRIIFQCGCLQNGQTVFSIERNVAQSVFDMNIAHGKAVFIIA